MILHGFHYCFCFWIIIGSPRHAGGMAGEVEQRHNRSDAQKMERIHTPPPFMTLILESITGETAGIHTTTDQEQGAARVESSNSFDFVGLIDRETADDLLGFQKALRARVSRSSRPGSGGWLFSSPITVAKQSVSGRAFFARGHAMLEESALHRISGQS